MPNALLTQPRSHFGDFFPSSPSFRAIGVANCAKVGCGPTVVSKRVDTDIHSDKGTLQLSHEAGVVRYDC